MKKLYLHEFSGKNGNSWYNEGEWDNPTYTVRCLGDYEKKRTYYHRVKRRYRDSDMVAINAIDYVGFQQCAWWGIYKAVSYKTDFKPDVIDSIKKALDREITRAEDKLAILKKNRAMLDGKIEYVVEGEEDYDGR